MTDYAGGWLNIREFGAAGNGLADDTAAFLTARDLLTPEGGALFIPPGDYLLASDGLRIEAPISLYSPGARLIQAGTTFPTSASLIRYESPIAATHTATGTLAATDSALTLNSVDGLEVGQTLFLKLGVAEQDATQPYLCQWNRVAAIDGLVVTFAVPFGEAIHGTAHAVIRHARIVENVTVEGLTLVAADGAEPDQAMYIERCRNVAVRNVALDHFGSIVNAQSENVLLENITVKRARIRAGYGASGNAIGGWNFHNYTIRNLDCQEVDRNGIYLEAHGRGCLIENYTYRAGADHAASGYGLWVGGGCQDIHLKNARLCAPYAGFFGIECVEGATLTTEDVTLLAQTRGRHFLPTHRGALGWDIGAGESWVDHQSRTLGFALTPNMTRHVTLPAGIYQRVRAYANDTTGITSLNFPAGGDFRAQLVAGQLVEIGNGNLNSLGPNAAYPFNNSAAKSVWIGTDATVPAGTILVLKIDYLSAPGDVA